MPRYAYSQGVALFPIGFEYTDPTHVGVNLVLPSGIERRLTLYRDYTIDNDVVVYVLPRDHGLVIFDDSPVLGPVFKASASRAVPLPESEPVIPVVQAVPMTLAAQEEIAEPAQDTGNSGRLAVLEAKLAELEKEKLALLDLERAKTSDAQIQALNQSGADGIASIEQTTNEAVAHIRAVSQSASRSAIESVAAASLDIENKAEEAAETVKNAQEMASEVENRIAAMLGNLDQRLDQIEAQNAESARNAQTLIAQAQSAALLNIESRAESVALQNEANARLEGSPWASEGYWIQTADIAALTVITLPAGLSYYPGRHSLRISVNGYTLIPGRDFEEYCTGNHPANQIRILYSAKKGDVWSIYILPTNALIAAIQAADAAEIAAQNADLAATNALEAQKTVQQLSNQTLTTGTENLNAIKTQGAQAVRNIGIARDNSLDEIRDATGKVRADCVNVWQVATGEIRKEAEASSQAARLLWQKAQADVAEARIDALQKAEAVNSQIGLKSAAAAESASAALDLARCVWRAAFNVAVDNAKPGLASVPSLNDLLVVASGIYIINPHLICKTPFMGVWPVASIEDALWDGFFFIGQPYPDKPINPLDPDDPLAPELPPYPEDPSIVPDMQPIASGSEWLPCDHTHNQE